MWVKQCHFYKQMGNDDYTTYKNGEIGDGKNDIL
jgi:hypothetical protein